MKGHGLSRKGSLVLVLLFQVTGLGTSYPSHKSVLLSLEPLIPSSPPEIVALVGSSGRSKVRRNVEPLEPVPEGGDPLVPLLEGLGGALEPEAFSQDLLLLQKLDRVNEVSKYNDPADNLTTVFQRPLLDTDKEVVVLSGEQDSRGSGPNKRTFIVLRRAPIPPTLPKTIYYHIAYAYIRDAGRDEAGRVGVGGRDLEVEWDGFESRAPWPTRFHAGWSNCHYTFLFSCALNQTALQESLENGTIALINQQVSQSPDTTTTTATTTIAPLETQGLEAIVLAGGGLEAGHYSDLYGDFDLIPRGGEKTGRGIFGSFGESLCKGFSLFGGGGSCGATSETKKKKSYKMIQQTTFGGAAPPPGVQDPLYESVYGTSGSSSGGGIGSYFGMGNLFGGSRPAQPDRQISNADAIFGTYYVGVVGTPPIFLPDGTQTPCLFVADSSSGSGFTAHGVYVAGTTGYPDSFIPDDPGAVAKVYSTLGTMIPDGMTMMSITGGIHGTLSGESFRPDTLGTPMWFNPENPDSKGVWSSSTKEKGGSRPKTTATGEMITYGVYFPGVQGSPDIFIPEGEGIPGYFVPNDPTKPDVVAIPHGSFIATKPAGHGSFYAENTKELANVQQVRGAFMPDGMNLTGAISGLITKDVANSYVFVVDVPGQEYSYSKGKDTTHSMWTPFLKPGDWAPPTTTPPPPKALPPPQASPPSDSLSASPTATKKKIANPSFMFGIKFSGQSAMDIFIPDNYPVEGQMFPEDPSFQPIQGQLIVSKQPNTAYVFKASKEGLVSTLPATIPAMFIPDGIAGGNGIMGELSPDSNKKNCTFASEGKGYWYIQGKAENRNVWTPFLPPVPPPTTKKPTLLDRIESQAFSTGFYVPGVPGSEPVFIPEEGALGCFSPDEPSRPKSCGTYYPPKTGIPAEFVQDVPNKLANSTPGTFVPELVNGSMSVDKFHGTFLVGPPGTILLDKPSYQGWSQTNVKVSTKKTSSSTTTTVTKEDRPSYTPIEVGGGFVGYPTNNRGIDALVDPNSPIFKEFLQWKSRKDKSMTENDRIVITSNGEGGQGPVPSTGTAVKTSYVSLDEYKSYVEERYTIKRTKIKTESINEMMELAIPKAAEKYVKKKKKPFKINVNVNSQAYAGAGAGAGAGGGGAGGKGSAGGGASGSGLGGGKCNGKWGTSASATAVAQNGSRASSEAQAINGGDAKAVSLAKDGANAESLANVKEGGEANAMAQSKNNSTGRAESNALTGGIANSLSKTSKDGGKGESVANAKRTGEVERDGCEGGGMPEEIEVDSHAAATALNNGTGTGGNVVNSYATTNVKIDMGSLMAKIMEMQKKQSEMDEDDGDDSPPFDININTNSQAGAGASGRTFGEAGGEQDGRSLESGDGKGGLVRSRGGWKTEYKVLEPNVTLQHEAQIFYGLGSCPYTSDPDPKSLASDDPEQVINFYLKVLRVDCIEKVKVRVMSLFNDDFLTFATEDQGDYLQFSPTNSVRSKLKLSDSEVRKLSSALEIHIFTKTYFEHLKSTSGVGVVGEGTGAPASRSLRFFTDFVLNFVVSGRELCPLHSVRLTRNMLTTVRTLMVKLHRDGEMLKKCPPCLHDIEMNERDKVRGMGLLQFLIHGLPPLDRGQEGAKDLSSTFTNFLATNRRQLETRVKEYESQFPTS